MSDAAIFAASKPQHVSVHNLEDGEMADNGNDEAKVGSFIPHCRPPDRRSDASRSRDQASTQPCRKYVVLNHEDCTK